MSDDDLIRRGDAREIFEDGGFLERSLDRLAALPAVTPATDAAALVDQARFLAERLREWEGDYINHDEAGTQWIGNVIPPLVRLEAILALLPKGGA